MNSFRPAAERPFLAFKQRLIQIALFLPRIFFAAGLIANDGYMQELQILLQD